MAFNWFVVAFCFLSTICIGRMVVTLRLRKAKVNFFCLLLVIVSLIGGTFLLTNEKITPVQSLIVSIILAVIFFSTFTSLYFAILKDEKEREERDRRYIR